MLLFVMTCITCGALVGMLTCAVIGPILITLAMVLTLTGLWVGGDLSGTQLVTWICLGATAHQLTFFLVIIGRYWAGDPLAGAETSASADASSGSVQPAPAESSIGPIMTPIP